MFVLRDDPSPTTPTTTMADEPASFSEAGPSTRLGRPLVCAACGASITTVENRIAVQGAHEHRFLNPAGQVFHIGCFASAIGCTIIGPDSLEYPWFVGFAWRYAMCGSCGQHLGWHFRDGESGFFGLILHRLVEPQSV